MVTESGKAGSIGRMAKVGSLALAMLLLGRPTISRAQQGTTNRSASPLLASSETTTRPSPPNLPAAPVTDYTVSPEDLLDVNVMGVPEVTREYRVSSNGFLTLPLLTDPIPAAGETLDQLQRLIAEKYKEAGMLNDAIVTVSLKETRFHTVLVSGEVVHPEAVPIFGTTRLLDVLIQAGGLTQDAGNEAIVRRGEMGARADLADAAESKNPDQTPRGQTFTLNIRKLVQTGDDTTNIILYPGDRVTVQRADLIYILGAVNRPGGYVLGETRRQITVLKALAMAGDVTGVAKKNHITLLRRDSAGPSEKREEIPVNYKAMVKGQIADMVMMPDDILYVPESRALKAWHSSINTATSVATYGGSSLIIYH